MKRGTRGLKLGVAISTIAHYLEEKRDRGEEADGAVWLDGRMNDELLEILRKKRRRNVCSLLTF